MFEAALKQIQDIRLLMMDWEEGLTAEDKETLSQVEGWLDVGVFQSLHEAEEALHEIGRVFNFFDSTPEPEEDSEEDTQSEEE